MRDSYTFYRSFIEGLRDVDDATFKRLVVAITNYALDGIEPELSGLEYGIFRSWKANIDASNKRKDNGKLGGRPKEKTIGYETETNGYGDNNHWLEVVKPNKNKKEKEKENKNENEKETKERGRFAPPSLEEVKAYCLERHNNVNPEAFIDFYESKGWKVGNQSMKDWKACIRTWEKREKPKDKVHFELERNYDVASLEERLLSKGNKYG